AMDQRVDRRHLAGGERAEMLERARRSESIAGGGWAERRRNWTEGGNDPRIAGVRAAVTGHQRRAGCRDARRNAPVNMRWRRCTTRTRPRAAFILRGLSCGCAFREQAQQT